MKEYIEHDLVMLESKEESPVGLLENRVLGSISSMKRNTDWSFVDKNWKRQHLYITSNDEIKEGDWYIFEEEVKQTTKETINYINSSGDIDFKKIIATTGKSLNSRKWVGVIEGEDTYEEILLPQIPQQFIEYFITEYNRGNVITKVLVEYETEENKNRNGYCQIDCNGTQQKNTPECCRNKLSFKVNPDNTINIKPIEVKMYSENEVKELFNKCNKELRLMAGYRLPKWLENNL